MQELDAVSNFLKTLSTNSPALWALMVLGVVAGAALVLYTLWELVLKLVSRN